VPVSARLVGCGVDNAVGIGVSSGVVIFVGTGAWSSVGAGVGLSVATGVGLLVATGVAVSWAPESVLGWTLIKIKATEIDRSSKASAVRLSADSTPRSVFGFRNKRMNENTLRSLAN